MVNHTAVKRAWRENGVQMANQENGKFTRGPMTTDPDRFAVGTVGALEDERRGQRFIELLSYLCHTLGIVRVAVYGYYPVQQSQEIILEVCNCFFYFIRFQARFLFHLRSTGRDLPRCV